MMMHSPRRHCFRYFTPLLPLLMLAVFLRFHFAIMLTLLRRLLMLMLATRPLRRYAFVYVYAIAATFSLLIFCCLYFDAGLRHTPVSAAPLLSPPLMPLMIFIAAISPPASMLRLLAGCHFRYCYADTPSYFRCVIFAGCFSPFYADIFYAADRPCFRFRAFSP